MSSNDLEHLHSSFLEPIPQEKLDQVLSKPPFIQNVKGAINLRRVPIPLPVYRSGDLASLDKDACLFLKRDLHIQRIFDLRSQAELAKRPVPEAIQDQGIEVVHCPILSNIITVGGQPSTISSMKRHAAHKEPETHPFTEDYAGILEQGKDWIKLIFDCWCASPTEAFLVNCSAGKDRTGTVVALIELVAGLDPDTVAHNYALTRYGLEPMRPFLDDLLLSQAKAAGMSEEDARKGAAGQCSSQAQVMHDLIAIIQEQYGGIDAYLINHVGLEISQLDNLKEALKSQ